MQGADTVELKLSVPERGVRSAVHDLGMDPLEAQIRQVVFLDTPDLQLQQNGVVVRARRTQGKPDDSVIKLRPVVPADLSPALRRTEGFGVEVDAMPGGFVCSARMKALHQPPLVKAALDGDQPIRKLFTKAQRAFYAAHAPEGLSLDDLTPLGPINVFKLKFRPPDYDRRIVAEMWLYPDGSRVLELSTKTLPQEAFAVAASTKAFLATHGVDLLAEQQTKTKLALEFFAGELAGSTV
jgi:hypothetical protein